MAVLLVIDHYEGFREAMRFCLPRFGHLAALASDTIEAVKHAAEAQLVLIGSTTVPGSALSTCAALKREPRLKHLPVILMVPQVTAVVLAEARGVGANAVISQVFDWPDFLSVVDRVLAAPSTEVSRE